MHTQAYMHILEPIRVENQILGQECVLISIVYCNRVQTKGVKMLL